MMTYHQRKNKNEIAVEIGEAGIIYKIKDDTVNRREKISYESILNDQYELYESNNTYKNNAIYTGIVGTIFLLINIFYGTKLWAWLFMLSCPIFYFLYYRSKAAFTVMKTTSDVNLVILQDKQHAQILEDIYKSRNNYLKVNYLTIDYENDPQRELNKFSWLQELDIISEREFKVIQEDIENNMV